MIATERLILRLSGVASPVILEEGEIYVQQYLVRDSVVVVCDHPCSVTQTTQNDGPTFMTHLPSARLYSTEIYYSYPTATDAGPVNRELSILTPTLRTDALFLNGKLTV